MKSWRVEGLLPRARRPIGWFHPKKTRPCLTCAGRTRHMSSLAKVLKSSLPFERTIISQIAERLFGRRVNLTQGTRKEATQYQSHRAGTNCADEFSKIIRNRSAVKFSMPLHFGQRAYSLIIHHRTDFLPQLKKDIALRFWQIMVKTAPRGARPMITKSGFCGSPPPQLSAAEHVFGVFIDWKFFQKLFVRLDTSIGKETKLSFF